MFRVFNRCRTASFSIRRFSTSLIDKEFGAHEKLRNVGLCAGAGIATVSAVYYIKSDKEMSTVKVESEVLENAVVHHGIKEVEVRRRIKNMYGYLLGGLGLTGATAFSLYQTKFYFRLLRFNPYVYLGGTAVAYAILYAGVRLTDYKTQYYLKEFLWFNHQSSMAFWLFALGLAGGPILAQASLATACIVGGQALLASKAPLDSLQESDGRGMDLGLLVSIVLGNLIFPMSIPRNILLYVGLGIMDGPFPTDTTEMLERARNDQDFDPITESLAFYREPIDIVKKGLSFVLAFLTVLYIEGKRDRSSGDDDK